MSGTKRKVSSRNTSGYNGVAKRGERYHAQIYVNKTMQGLGTHDTAKEAAIAYDHAVTQHKLSPSKLNYPDGLPLDDEHYNDFMNPKKTRRRSSNNTTGYTGVSKRRKRFRAEIRIDGKNKYLGTYDTPKEAALVFDRAVTQHKLPSSKLNYPDGLPLDDEDYDELMNPKKTRRRSSNNTTGYTGVVRTVSKRFVAQIRIKGKKQGLGTYGTAKEAALAFDRAVVQYKLSSSRLNFPNDVASSGGDDGDDGDDGDENDDDEALAFPPVPSVMTTIQASTAEENGVLGNGDGSNV